MLTLSTLWPHAAISQEQADSVYQPSQQPTPKIQYRFGDPFSNRTSLSPFLLKDPSQVGYELKYDSGFTYSVYERLNELNFRPATTMSFEQYDRYHDEKIISEYWRDQSIGLEGESAVGGRRLIPKLYISPTLDRIFGGSYVDIQPTGFVNLDFGGLFQFLDNPSIPQRQRRNGGFNFNMQISSNVVGKIGEKLAVTFNFDNNNTFDFQNDMKVDYTGFEEEIIKKIEIGNVSMPVSNGLISGAQSLFGVKTQLQFGRLYVTGVASRQRGRNEVLNIENGVDEQQFEMRASDYDENRHFFLGHFFRENYGIESGQWLSNLPQIISGVNITRVEVYVLNRNNETAETRNFLALMDLGESRRIGNANIAASTTEAPTTNNANDLWSRIRNNSAIRNPGEVNAILESDFGMVESTDFVKVTTARKLDLSEYTIDKELGYISLMRRLQNDEVLAVSYEYTYNGKSYSVGELTEDYQGLADDKLIYLKMLRPNKIETRTPTWDLMMKNIYNLNAGQVQRNGFTLRIHYRDDRTGQDNPSLHEGRQTKDRPILELVGLDRLNPNNDRQRDGNFDYVEGVTVNSKSGTIIFPVVEPFGETLESWFEDGETDLKEKYVFDTLYRTTKADAELVASKNKFFILGKFSGGSSSEIVLPGISVAPNSVIVMAGNTPLTEGLQYTVDYNLGRVRIIDEGILSSGKNISISYEKADLFNFQTRWLTGAQFDYIFNDNLSLGATILHVNERPGGISRYSIGSEPTKNSKYGFNINYKADSRFLTKMIDALPLISTKEPSNITFNAEFAQLKPGTSNIVNGEGTSYLDDFENAITPISLGGWPAWSLASVPQTSTNEFDLSSETGEALGLNYKRAKIAWYTVDNSVFYRSIGSNRPDNITDSDLENHYVKAVYPQDIYQQQDRNLVVVPENIFDIAYFPSERGPYNYNPNLDADGLLDNPEENWGGMMRSINNEVDFDKTNVEYLEFWLMDPFIGHDDGNTKGIVQDGIFNEINTTGGELVFNLGNVSEDVNRDGKHFFENGLPNDGNLGEATESIPWGYTPSVQYLTNFFENTSESRANQDVGYDGLPNSKEADYFQDFINQLNVRQSVRDAILADPSADNFSYFLGDSLDNIDAKIIQRYKNYNGLDGNSPVNTTGLTQASTVLPDNEDLNKDNTLTSLEEYYEYRVPLKPGALDVGEGHIVDKVVDRSGEATWYLFRIPVKNAYSKVGNIDGFKTIRYMRMYLTKFSQPVVLRMSKLQLVGSQWRKYEEPLNEVGFNQVSDPTTSDFSITVVNIEENSVGDEETSPYVVPPGLNRDRDNTTFLNRRNNEQSLQLCVEGLEDKDARAVYKNVSYDLINYGRLKMFFHAEAYRGDMVLDDEVSAFLRFGTDFTENFYEIEVPLKITPKNLTASGDALPRLVWPLENEIDLSINELLGLKSERNRNDLNKVIPYTGYSNDGKYKMTVKGNPDISTILTMMIGVRNPESQDRSPKSVCIWANELRLTDFDTHKGWAANARIAAKLADLGNVSASARYTSIGFGTIQQRISERTREESFQYDISANVNVDKFLLPQKTGLKVPMFVSYEESIQTPQFDPLDPDVPLDASLESYDTEEERQSYRKLVQDRSVRRSINFTNVHKEKVKKDRTAQIYDISNFSASYAYSDQTTSNINTETYLRKSQSGGLAYNYSPKGLSITPFANAKWLSNPYLKMIKDLNFSPLPNSLSARADLNRSFIYTQLYNDQRTTSGIAPYYERLFTFNRSYSFRWAIFKGLSTDYSAKANAVIDENGPIEGDIDTQLERDFVWEQIKDLGRMKNFTQDMSATYKLPLDKLPLSDWLAADVRYSVGSNWIAGSLNQEDTLGNFFGHTLQNKRDRTATGKADLVKLYNKVGFLKKINTPSRKKNDETAFAVKIGKGFVRSLMSVRSVNASYGIRESTVLSGFTPTPFILGMDSTFSAPGWDFLLGSQDPTIRYTAAENGWLTKSEQLTNPFQQTSTVDLTLKATVEPMPDLKIQLDANRSYNADYREYFRNVVDRDENEVILSEGYESLTPTQTGAYNISFMTINTAFGDDRNNNISATFEQFRENLDIVRRRQETIRTASGVDGRYDSLSQDVMIPAFIAAYSGQSAYNTDLRPFPVIPIPNWRVDFAGLSKLPGLSDWFSSVNITHAYRSTYAVGNYTNNQLYATDPTYVGTLTLDNSIINYPSSTEFDPEDPSQKLVPVYQINQVTISEQFAPLVGINVRTNNNINARIDFKKDRNLSLNMSNAQIAETTNNDMSIDVGWTKDKLKLPFKIQGRTVTIENDVTFRFNMTIRDGKTIQRKLNGENIVSNGNRNFQLRPSMSYRLNDQLDLTMYFDRNVTDPRVASTFKRASTSFGFQMRFSLAQL